MSILYPDFNFSSLHCNHCNRNFWISELLHVPLCTCASTTTVFPCTLHALVLPYTWTFIAIHLYIFYFHTQILHIPSGLPIIWFLYPESNLFRNFLSEIKIECLMHCKSKGKHQAITFKPQLRRGEKFTICYSCNNMKTKSFPSFDLWIEKIPIYR